jgi:2,3-dihydroxy-p-cumate/2,3-dihydroxybenzoate 3,4-dioxygenase
MLRYSKLGIVELNVTNLSRSQDFYKNLLGLEPAPAASTEYSRYRCTDDSYSVVLHQSNTAGLKRVGWELDSIAQFDELYCALRTAEIKYEELSADECNQRLFQRAARIVEPFSCAVFEFYVWADNLQTTSWQPTVAKIQRLGHVAFWTPDPLACTDFLHNVLNFRFSDSIGDAVTFMRPFPSPYHHGIGVASAKKTGLHHVNFMVSDIDDVGKAFHRFNRHGVEIMKGIGRHPASGSIFLYFLDPDGLTLEYSFGMEEFPEDKPREARKLPLKPESIDIWLGPVDKRYATMGEVEKYQLEK